MESDRKSQVSTLQGGDRSHRNITGMHLQIHTWRGLDGGRGRVIGLAGFDDSVVRIDDEEKGGDTRLAEQ